MSISWRERYDEIDALSAEVHADLRKATRDDAGHRRWSDLLDGQDGDKGYLMDLAQLFQQHSRATTSDAVQRLAEVQLSYMKDFAVLHTLSSQPQIGCSVAVVYARNLGTSKRVYAAKTMTKSSAMKLEGQTTMQHERDILEEARKSRIAQVPALVAAMQDETTLTVLMEYQPAGDLGLLLEDRKTLPEAWTRLWAAECLVALIWLHDLGYIHRDVKPANLLLTLEGHVKLMDFASAARTIPVGGLKRALKRYCMMPVGTVDYIAADILLAHERVIEEDSIDESLDDTMPGPYDNSIDLWSYGVMLYEMTTGTLPFFADTIPETYEKILHHQDTLHLEGEGWSASAKSLVGSLLTVSDERLGRANSGLLRGHPYFSSLNWDGLHRQPGPFKPQIRVLPDAANQTTFIEPPSRGFDFSALFSSPGLSILRDTPNSSHDEWLGFNNLPEPDEFDARSSDITRARIVQSGSIPQSARKAAPLGTSYPPCTPARSSLSPFAHSASHLDSSNRRRHEPNAAALKQVVDYGILKTARKASAATARKQREKKLEAVELQRRHKKLIGDIGEIDDRYKHLFRKAEEVEARPSAD